MYLLAIDLGGSSAKIAFLKESGEIFLKWEVKTDISYGGINIVPNICTSIRNKLNEHNLREADILGIGIGAPGQVLPETGEIIEAVNLNWKRYPLKEKVCCAFDSAIPVFVDNDANIAAYGEMWLGAGIGTQNMIAITLGTGVGGGVICNGQIVKGAIGASGEIGHMRIILSGGLPCNCGNSGCLETLVSARGVVWEAEATMKMDEYKDSKLHSLEDLTAKDVFDLASAGDAGAAYTVDRVCYHLGSALANIAVVLDPEVIIIGGGVAKAGDQLLLPTQAYFNKYVFLPIKGNTKLKLAKLGNDAGIIGAGALILKNL